MRNHVRRRGESVIDEQLAGLTRSTHRSAASAGVGVGSMLALLVIAMLILQPAETRTSSPYLEAVFVVVGVIAGPLAVLLSRRLLTIPVRLDSGAVAGVPALRDAIAEGVPSAELVASLYVASIASLGIALVPAALGFLGYVLGSPLWLSVVLVVETFIVEVLVFPRYPAWEQTLAGSPRA